MLPRLKSSFFKSILLMVLILFFGYIHYLWRRAGVDLQEMFHHYTRRFRRGDPTDSRDRFDQLFDELVSMEKFTVALEEPQAAILIPAWLKEHVVKSNNKTFGKAVVHLERFGWIARKISLSECICDVRRSIRGSQINLRNYGALAGAVTLINDAIPCPNSVYPKICIRT